MPYVLDRFSQSDLKMHIDDSNAQNVHYDDSNRFSILIGNNGTGKSRLLTEIAKRFSAPETEHSRLLFEDRPAKTLAISNMVFDKYPLNHWENDSYVYLGARQGSNMLTTGTWSTYVHECAAQLYLANRLESLIPTLDLLNLRIDDAPILARTEVFRRRSDEIMTFLHHRGASSDAEVRPKGEISAIKQVRVMDQETQDALQRLLLTVADLTPSISLKKNRKIFRRGLHIDEVFPRFTSSEELALRFCLQHNLVKAQVSFSRGDLELPVEELSAGEQLLLSLMARILAHVKNDSLVLIDEPDVGLHPEWQSNLIPLLTGSIHRSLGSHFIMATHSPLIVADGTDILVPGGAAGVFVPFSGEVEGRSIETILYEAFAARTPRSHLVELDLSYLIKAISSSPRNVDRNRVLASMTRLNAIAGDDTPAVNMVLADAYLMLGDL